MIGNTQQMATLLKLYRILWKLYENIKIQPDTQVSKIDIGRYFGQNKIKMQLKTQYALF